MSLLESLQNLLRAVPVDAFGFGEGQAVAIRWSCVLFGALVAAYWDVRKRRIPNALTFPLLFFGLLWQVWMAGFPGFLNGILGSILVVMPFLVLFLYAGGGAGDAKLMGAMGAWLGVSEGLIALVAIVVSGAILGLVYAARERRLEKVFGNIKSIGAIWMARIGQEEGASEPIALPPEEELTPMPYALAILCGTCISATAAFM